jgi:hypothetical protein
MQRDALLMDLLKPHNWLIIEMYCNTAMQQNNIWSIACEAHTQEILKEACRSNGPYWMLHAQTGTSFVIRSIMLNTILFNQPGSQSQSIIISNARNPTQSVWNSLVPFWRTI